jgi:hypothetical protein
MDFIVSFDKHLILIKAKAYTSYKNDQAAGKLERLRLLREFYIALDGSQQRPIEFHFLFASPTAPQKLEVEWTEWKWACKDAYVDVSGDHNI